MKQSLRHFSNSLVLGVVCLFMQIEKSEAQTVLAVNEVRVVSTSGIVAAKSADGKTETITLQNVSAGETPIAAMQGSGSTLATGAASNAFISIPSTGTFRMGANTQVRLPKADEKSHSLELLKGQLFMNINAEELKERGPATFRLKTPAALLAVKGTRFFAISAGDTDTAGVNQGSVEVIEPISKQALVLNTGRAVSISMGVMGKERSLTKEESLYEKFYALEVPKTGSNEDKLLKVTSMRPRSPGIIAAGEKFTLITRYKNPGKNLVWIDPSFIVEKGVKSPSKGTIPIEYFPPGIGNSVWWCTFAKPEKPTLIVELHITMKEKVGGKVLATEIVPVKLTVK